MSMIVGYGTLLSQHSLGRTIGQEHALSLVYVPVMVLDFRRLYNLRPTHYDPSCELGIDGLESAAANVELAAGQQFNGLMFEADAGRLSALDERERYYRRVEVEVADFATRESLGSGFTYMCSRGDSLLNRDPAKLLPHWRDIVLARTGAYQVSEEFGRLYDETSFLADGRTLVVDRYRDHLNRMSSEAPNFT